MIVWIASYPKSGNTWMRFFIKSYLNNSNKKFSLNNHIDDTVVIETFPTERKFGELKINYQDFNDIAKNWVDLQSSINLNNKINYLKTHNAMCTINNHKFTNIENTLGSIHIVRDPRDILVSYSNYLNEHVDETLKTMLSDHSYEAGEFKNNIYKKSIIGSWSSHYNSWKSYKSRDTIIIKYEDMVHNTYDTFLRVLNYLKKITNLEINEKKMIDAINQISFKNLKNLELTEGFKENSSINPFFRTGIVGEWKKKLSKEQVRKIEKAFKIEMKELGYL